MCRVDAPPLLRAGCQPPSDVRHVVSFQRVRACDDCDRGWPGWIERDNLKRYDKALQLRPNRTMRHDMHRSRLCALLIDCKTSDVDEAARFWAKALGRAVDLNHWGSRGNYRMLETPPDEPVVQIQRVDHESRVHLDIETDDIPAEVARLGKLGAKLVNRLDRWVVMQAPTGQRFCVVRVQRPGFPKNANSWD